MMSDEPQPYTNEDIFRESSEGRSLHDDASKFYRVIMKLPVPVAIQNQPTVDEITLAFSEKVRKDDLKTWNIIYSLNLTERSALWLDTDDCNHSVGMFWKACAGYSGAALGYIHACNLDVQKSKSKSSPTKKRKALSLKKTPVKKSKSVSRKDIASPSTTSHPNPPNDTVVTPNKKDLLPSQKSNRTGNKNWSTTEINLLLDATEYILPCGKEMWEKCALECLLDLPSWCRPGVSCKSKFEKMAFCAKPTGQTEIPLHIKRAKNIKDKISQKEVIGCVQANESISCMTDDDEETTTQHLKLASLLHPDEKSVRRPKTNAQKSKDLSEAIAQVGRDNLAGTKKLTEAIESVAGAMSKSGKEY